MKFFARSGSPKRRGKLFRYGWKIGLFGLIAAAGLSILVFYGVWAQTFDMKKVGEMPERNTVFDVDGKIYSRLAGANRLKVSLSEVSPFFIDALLAREDTRFYQHKGIDWHGIMRALVRDLLSGSAKEGASSITQQLARNSLPLGGRTINRKILEAMVALRVEQKFTKQQILELYINRIYFGSGCYGVETASQAYFGKSASKLNLSEAALLAGLIRSPNRFSPLKNPEGAALQRNAVLDRMAELKKISAGQAEQAKLARVNTHPKRLLQVQENYAMDAVQRDLNLLLTQDQIDNGGLYIYTTLDPAVENAAQQALETQLTKIEHQPNFHHPLKANYQPPENGEDSSMPYSIAHWPRPTGKSVPPLSLSFTRSPSPMDFCPAPPSVMGRFNRAKLKAQEIGHPEIPTALMAASNLVPTD
jgi:penicillin-binding protein 1A